MIFNSYSLILLTVADVLAQSLSAKVKQRIMLTFIWLSLSLEASANERLVGFQKVWSRRFLQIEQDYPPLNCFRGCLQIELIVSENVPGRLLGLASCLREGFEYSNLKSDLIKDKSSAFLLALLLIA